MNFVAISSFSILVLTINMGVQVLLYNTSEIKNRLFFLLCISIGGWMATHLITDTTRNTEVALMSARIGLLFVCLIPIVFNKLTDSVFPTSSPFSHTSNKILLWIILTISFFTLTPFNIKSLNLGPEGIIFEPGLLYTPLLFYLIFYFGTTFKKIIRIADRDKDNSIQARFILYGSVSTFLMAITSDLILPLLGLSWFSLFSPLSVLFFICAASVAVYKLGLFGLRSALTHFIILCIWTILIVRGFYFPPTEFLLYFGLIVCILSISILLIKRTVQLEIQEDTLVLLSKKAKELDRIFKE